MSDLISRQTVLDILQEEKSLRCGYDADIAILSIEKKIKEQPTAYDVEKVVSDIEKLYEEASQFGLIPAPSCIVDVVKRGGVE